MNFEENLFLCVTNARMPHMRNLSFDLQKCSQTSTQLSNIILEFQLDI